MSTSIWGTQVETLTKEIETLVLTGLEQSTDHFTDDNQSEYTTSKQMIQTFYSKIAPETRSNLAVMKEYIRRNIFDLPDGFDLTSATNLLDQQFDNTIQQQDEDLDKSIQNTKTQLLKCDHLDKQLDNIENTLQQRNDFINDLKNTSNKQLITDMNQDFNHLIHSIKQSEEDFEQTSQIINTYQYNDENQKDPYLSTVEKVIRKSKDHAFKDITMSVSTYEQTLKASEEHEPIQHFLPSAKSILQISMQGDEQKLKDLAALKSRLLG